MARLRSDRGITIIETTVVLSVLFILAGAMSPIVSESITTARSVKAKSDASMIAMGLINLQKDLGGDALSFGGAGGALAGNSALDRGLDAALEARAERIIHELDEAGRAFHVLVIKTNMTIPYTSVFLELRAAYWGDEAEERLRKSMAK